MKKILVCLLILSSCISRDNRMQQQEDVVKSEPPYLISLEKEIDNIKSAGLSEVGSTITYIPLETNDRSLLKDLRKIIVTDAHITVRDVDNILMFDSSGTFLSQIGRRGQGPGEYRNIMDYCFSFDNSKIYLLTTYQQCLEYNVEGRFLNSYKIDSMPSQMLPLRDELFVFHCNNVPEYVDPVRQSLIISDLNNNMQKTYENYYKRTQKPGMMMPRVPFYFHQEKMRFKEFGVDTLYTITEEELIPHAIINLGGKEMPADLSIPLTPNGLEETVREHFGKFWVKWVLEDVDNFYITLDNYINSLYGYYNKYDNSVKIIGQDVFQNDIDGGLPFFPKYVYNDNILVDYVNAFTLREHVLNGNTTETRRLYGQKYDDLVKLANSIDDESNPIVVMIKK